MPYDYREQTSILNGNIHTLTLRTPIFIEEEEEEQEEEEEEGEPFDYHEQTSVINGNAHTLTLTTPIVKVIDAVDYELLSNKPLINGVELIGDTSLETLGIQAAGECWEKEELIPMTPDDIDIITGLASSESSFRKIYSTSDEVTIDKDLVFDEPLIIDKNFTLNVNEQEIQFAKADKYFIIVDGCQFTIKGNGAISTARRIANVINGGKLIIENGTFRSSDVGFTCQGQESEIEFNGGELYAVEGGLGAYGEGRITFNGGEIVVSDNFAIFTSGESGNGNNIISVNGGSLISNIFSSGYQACGVYIANNDIFIMNDGEIIANNGCGILMRAGHVTINHGYIEGNGVAGTKGRVGSDETEMSKSAIIYHEQANYPGKAGMSLVINDGQFVGVDHSVEILSNEITPNVAITGGDFVPAYPE